MIIETLQRKLQRKAMVSGALAAFAFAGMGHVATAQTAKSAEGAVAAPATIDATLAPYQQVPLSQVSAESMGAKAKAAKAKPVAAEEEETATPSKPGSEGIKVHGHWVLQVKNADGTLGERREFENSLITTYTTGIPGFPSINESTSGAAVLAAALSGNITLSDPAIAFVQGPMTGDPSQYCAPADGKSLGVPVTCWVFTDANSLFNFQAEPSTTTIQNVQLGTSATATFTPNANIVVSGNYIVPAGLTSIAGVQSLVGGCVSASFIQKINGGTIGLQLAGGPWPFGSSPIATNGCTNANAGNINAASSILDYFALTSVQLSSGGTATPLAVTAGQVITVTFTLSFS